MSKLRSIDHGCRRSLQASVDGWQRLLEIDERDSADSCWISAEKPALTRTWLGSGTRLLAALRYALELQFGPHYYLGMGVLVVGDNVSEVERLSVSLPADGFVVDPETLGTNLRQRLYRRDSDAIVFDLRLLYDGIVESISELRARGLWTPILVAVDSHARSELLRVLDAGADDYLAKPVPISEIAARLRALIRRASAPRWAPLECGAVVLTPDVAEINVAGEAVKLSPRERSLLQLLLRRRMQIVSREEILSDVFGYDFNPGTNLIDVQITRLRHKVASGGITIEAIRGQGFRLKPTSP